ncbi:hypothetical protein SESBI_25084 [Sesbania bispinosa]|nr:hypothetical protein SESBI_25084 [Sesbania bispinosa]
MAVAPLLFAVAPYRITHHLDSDQSPTNRILAAANTKNPTSNALDGSSPVFRCGRMNDYRSCAPPRGKSTQGKLAVVPTKGIADLASF